MDRLCEWVRLQGHRGSDVFVPVANKVLERGVLCRNGYRGCGVGLRVWASGKILSYYQVRNVGYGVLIWQRITVRCLPCATATATATCVART